MIATGGAAAAVDWLKRHGTKASRAGMARYGIPSDRAFGVPVGALMKYAKGLGRDHALALALWKTGWYEARMLASYVDEPERVTAAQMESWCRDFDSWAICDTVCFKLFDRVPGAMRKVAPWSRRKDEFVKRAAFALLASLALHDKTLGDAPFLAGLVLIEREAGDDRNFVKKSALWALRAIGGRGPALHARAVAAARRLSESAQPSARWIGKTGLREFTKSRRRQP